MARFLASCSGVKFATPLDPGAAFLFLDSEPPGPMMGVECWEPPLADPAGESALASKSARSLFTPLTESLDDGAGDTAVMESL